MFRQRSSKVQCARCHTVHIVMNDGVVLVWSVLVTVTLFMYVHVDEFQEVLDRQALPNHPANQVAQVVPEIH